MTELASLINELKTEIHRSRSHQNRHHIDVVRIESLIRKYEIQIPGDISKQPGNYQIRGGNVEAKQHAGTFVGAQELKDWIQDLGGRCEWLGTYDQEVDWLRLRLSSPREPNIVGPGWWVIKTADGIFFAVGDADFHIIYVPREEGEHTT